MLLSIDEKNRQPIYLQIVRQIKEQILMGELKVGDELPSVRELGESLAISLHTARSAYQVLSEQGLLRVRLGKRARVVALAEEAVSGFRAEEYAARMRELVVDGLLQGTSADRLHRLMDQEIEALSARGTIPNPRHRGKEAT